MTTKVRLYHPETGEPSPELWPLDAVDWQENGWLTEPPAALPSADAPSRTRRRGTLEPEVTSELND